MQEKIFRNATLSLVLINFWSLYLFFDYFTEKRGMLFGLELFFNFLYSTICVVGFGFILLIIQLGFHLTKKVNPLKSNFFYIFCGIFNLNIFIICLICVILKILKMDEDGLLVSFMASPLFIGCFIIADIYKSNFRNLKE